MEIQLKNGPTELTMESKKKSTKLTKQFQLTTLTSLAIFLVISSNGMIKFLFKSVSRQLQFIERIGNFYKKKIISTFTK